MERIKQESKEEIVKKIHGVAGLIEKHLNDILFPDNWDLIEEERLTFGECDLTLHELKIAMNALESVVKILREKN